MASITQLDALGKDALRALLAAEGALPVHTFAQRFGPIRPYWPWRKEEAGVDQPWLAPISTTETLWYLGLTFQAPPKPQPGQVQHYVIPADLLPHLAVHLAPAAVDPALRPQPQPGRLDTDVPFRCLDAAVAWSINPWSAASFASFLNAVSR